MKLSAGNVLKVKFWRSSEDQTQVSSSSMWRRDCHYLFKQWHRRMS
jgi:hypothetical protein